MRNENSRERDDKAKITRKGEKSKKKNEPACLPTLDIRKLPVQFTIHTEKRSDIAVAATALSEGRARCRGFPEVGSGDISRATLLLSTFISWSPL